MRRPGISKGLGGVRKSAKSAPVTAAITLFLVLACTGNAPKAPATRPFPLVSVPSVLSQDQKEAEAYALRHYWDAFADTSLHHLRCDSLHVGGVPKKEAEQAFSNWLYVLEKSGPASYDAAVNRFYEQIELCERNDSSSNIYEGMCDIACSYLFDPNSPMRDEQMYLPLCRRLSESPLQDSLQREKYARQAEACSRNQVGEAAADFSFCDRNGRTFRLHGIRADWTLLFFSNPGCTACKEIIETLKKMDGFDDLIATRRLAVVNVYIDEDLGEWFKYMPYYPDNWYNGYDPNLVIRGEGLYDVRAIPSLYLLDKDKRVVLKDAPEPRMYHKLAEIFGRSNPAL